MNLLRNTLLLTAAAILAHATPGAAQTFVDYNSSLGGTTVHHTWSGFTLPPGVSPGVAGAAGQWAGTSTPTNLGFASNGGSTADQFYVPLAPGGTAQYSTETTDFVGGGIYTFFSSTHFQLSSTAPLASTETFVLQLSVAAGTPTPSGGAPTNFLSAPVLKLTLADTSTVTLAANFSLVENSGPYTVPVLGFNTTLSTIGYQWDLSSVTQPITSYTVDYQLAYHGMIFGADSVASSEVHSESVLTAIPEPGTALFGALLVGMAFARRQRRQVALAA